MEAGQGTKLINDSDKTIRRVLAPLSSGAQIPFMFLTNGGMKTEQKKCDELNTLFKLTQEEPRLDKSNVFLCHTVFG